jgi:hypothetical protein
MKKSLEDEKKDQKNKTKYCPIKDGYCNENCMFWFEEDCMVLSALMGLTLQEDDVKTIKGSLAYMRSIRDDIKKIAAEMSKLDGIKFIRR